MRSFRPVLFRLLPLPLLLTASLASAQTSLGSSSLPTVARAPQASAAAALPVFGIMADAGLPDGTAASLVFRPTSWIRLHGGGTYNFISSGVRSGATWLPLGWGPSLTVEGGHYFDGNANQLARRLAGADFKSNAALERIGYDYANAHLGLDFGSRRATFYLHGGVSVIRATVHNLDDVVQSQTSADGSSTQVIIKQDPTIRAFTPSVKLGLIVYLW
jgi:hypothetical protein